VASPASSRIFKLIAAILTRFRRRRHQRKATAREQQAGQASAHDGTMDIQLLIVCGPIETKMAGII